MIKKISIIILLLIMVLFSSLLFAENDVAYVQNLIKSKTDEIIKVIRDKKLTQKEKKKKIFEIASPLFDFNIMAKLTLGRKYWFELTPKQRKKFVKLFIKRIKMAYLDRVSIYGNEKIIFKPAIQKKKIIIYVPSIISSKGQDYSIVYKFWKSPKGWKIYDVEVEGVSIIRSYRAQFTKVLSTGGVKELFKELEKLTSTSGSK